MINLKLMRKYLFFFLIICNIIYIIYMNLIYLKMIILIIFLKCKIEKLINMISLVNKVMKLI